MLFVFLLCFLLSFSFQKILDFIALLASFFPGDRYFPVARDYVFRMSGLWCSGMLQIEEGFSRLKAGGDDGGRGGGGIGGVLS